MKSRKFTIKDTSLFKSAIISYSEACSNFCILDSCSYTERFSANTILNYKYELLAGFGIKHEFKHKDKGAFKAFKKFVNTHSEWFFGYLSYDLKNDIENFNSNNPDKVNFADIHFFVPEIVITLQKNEVIIYGKNLDEINLIFEKISDFKNKTGSFSCIHNIQLNPRIDKKKYISIIEKLKGHIAEGDVYEINFCQEFYNDNAKINPHFIFQKLQKSNPNPFSSFYRTNDQYIICSSMERFLMKEAKRLISQPIKGTIKRGLSKEDDELQKRKLLEDPKERAENVMIVDLVRNDLSRSAIPGTTKVDELFGIYTFPNVHQMISTVSAQKKEDIHFTDTIRNAFPMGSMTGAPKYMALKLIEEYEISKRGVYSGAIGYITPWQDFDFNVVIRTMLYDQAKKYLSVHAGSAITFDSVAEKEYEECLLKIEGVKKLLED